MRFFKANAVTVATLLVVGLSGCATVSELIDDPSVEHSAIKKPKSTETGHVILTAREDNRLIRTSVTASNKLLLCAETQADAISTRSSQSGIEITGKASVEDEISRRLMLTYARTEVSDVVRQLAWQLCNAHLNGQIGDSFYETSLRSLQTQAMAVLAATPETKSTALEQMTVLADKAEVSAAADRELDKVLEEEKTKQSSEMTKRARIRECRKAETVSDFQTCVGT